MNGIIAERHLRGINNNGEIISILIRIGKPYQKSLKEWACKVELDGLHEKLSEIIGVDSFQSLILAINFIKSLLNTFKEQGGKFISLSDDQEIELEDLFIKGI